MSFHCFMQANTKTILLEKCNFLRQFGKCMVEKIRPRLQLHTHSLAADLKRIVTIANCLFERQLNQIIVLNRFELESKSIHAYWMIMQNKQVNDSHECTSKADNWWGTNLHWNCFASAFTYKLAKCVLCKVYFNWCSEFACWLKLRSSQFEAVIILTFDRFLMSCRNSYNLTRTFNVESSFIFLHNSSQVKDTAVWRKRASEYSLS